jgi:hypothetical protein
VIRLVATHVALGLVASALACGFIADYCVKGIRKDLRKRKGSAS